MVVEQVVHGDEKRELDEQRQAAGHRVIVFALVELGHFLVELLRIAFVLRLQLLDFGLKLCHPCGGHRTFLCKGIEQRFDEYRHQDNRDAIVRNEFIEEIKEEFEKILEPAQHSRSFHGIFQLEARQAKPVLVSIFIFPEFSRSLGAKIEVIGIGSRHARKRSTQ